MDINSKFIITPKNHNKDSSMVLQSNEGVSTPHGDSLVERLLDIERRQSLSAFMEASRTELELFRRSIDATTWEGFVDSVAAANLRPVFLADPYTQRGFVKPRGYAGDAVLLDYIYETTPIPEFTSKRGSRIYRWMCKESKAFHAVRYRRELIAQRIDAAISANPSARILSIACGHLREFALCKFDLRKWNGELVALDQDPASLAIVANTYRTQSITPTRASIGALVSGTIELGKFDLIYAAGLLDYLDDSTVSSLTNWCRQSLNQDGSVLLANFYECEERGFMESVMRWQLIYRSAPSLAGLVQQAMGAAVTSFYDPFKVVAYVEAR